MIDTSRTILHHVSNLNTESQRISYQMGTGKNLKNGSENSLLHADIIGIEDKLRVTQSLKLQITKSNAANEVSDTSFAEMKQLLDKIKVDLMRGLNAGIDRNDKLAIAKNIEGIRENIFDLSNVRVDGEYVFSGSVSTEKTFVKDSDYKNNGKVTFNGDGFLRKIAVQPGSYRDRGVTGYDLSTYTSSRAISGESFSFENGERIIDSEGHEWKLNASEDKLQKYDHNGVVYHPPIEMDIKLSPATQMRVDLGTGGGFVAAGGEVYEFEIDGNTFTYTAGAGDTETDIYNDLEADIIAAGYSVSGFPDEGDKFYINSTTNMEWTSPGTATVSVSNEIEASSSKQAIQKHFEIDGTIPTEIIRSSGEVVSIEHLQFEAKHSYFEDLNIMINALEGYSTKLDGSKSSAIQDSLVDDTLRNNLEQTSKQFDATNIGHGELGGRNHVFNIAYDKISAQETHYNILLEQTSGADMTKLAMESKALEMTYTGLYSTIMKMNELSLVNFIK